MKQADGQETELKIWRSEWRHVRDRVVAEGVSLETLRPDYFRFQTLRLDGEYVFIDDPLFEHQIYIAILRLLFTKYLLAFSKVIDLGCGTGTSLYLLSQVIPKVELFGCDWVPESQEIVHAIGHTSGASITGLNFNMKTVEGHEAIPIDPESAVITLHSMEQLGSDFEAVLDLLLTEKPKLVLHLEPLVELYDEENLFDQFAATFHRQRNYLDGYLTRLRELATQGRVEIIEERRFQFGSTWHEAYSLLVWQPL
jgi:SAM-dependent methyltransferase